MNNILILYYFYLFIVYGCIVLKVILNKYLKGYKRGFCLHIMSTIKLIIQIVIVITAIFYINYLYHEVYNEDWDLLSLISFLVLWGFTIIVWIFYTVIVFV